MPRDKNIFTLNPTSLDMKRSVFPIKVQHKTSLNLGDIVPIYFKEILPGDTISLDMAHVIRTSSALVAPIMDNIYADVYFFFVPNRLVWEHWEQFCGANDVGAWTQTTQYTIPQAEVHFDNGSNDDLVPGTIGNYLGLPYISTGSSGDLGTYVSELPLRAYWKIYNDWFADENSIGPKVYTIGDLPNTSISYGYGCAKASRFHDLFSSCLPAPQKGASVTLPLGSEAPLMFENTGTSALTVSTGTNSLGVWGKVGGITSVPAGEAVNLGTKAGGTGTSSLTNQSSVTAQGRLFADLSNATAATVNQVRMAFQLQKLLEKDARGGTRYQEMILAHFGTRGADARLQRAEYLCGHRFMINVDQVISHTETVDSGDDVLNPLGSVAAMSKTTGAGSMFTKSFTEHGMLFGLIVLRQDHTYSEGLDRYWSKKERFDFYYPVLANIGEVPVYKGELSVRGMSPVGGSYPSIDKTGVFGYQEAWFDYRYQPSRATGYMNPASPNSLSQWTLGDVYANVPTLNRTFLEETPIYLDRALSVTSQGMHQFICDFYFKGKQARVMPLYSIPGLIDHH